MVRSLRKENRELRKKLSNRESIFHPNYFKYDELTKREQSIFDFIEANTGCSKEDVVKFLKGKFSRVAILNSIKAMENENIIISKENVENKHTRSLVINNANIALKVKLEIEDFRLKLFKILDALEGSIGKRISENSKDLDTYFTHLREIYDKFIFIIFSRAMLQWQTSIPDEKTLFQLNVTTARNTIEIQQRISKLIPTGHFKEEICLDDDSEPYLISSFSEVGLKDEIENLIHSIRSLNYLYRKNRIDYFT
ncbi:hypothetical protein [Candidatus Nitrosocosmicus sp. SS]|jgi:hypothetical protein|uniref:hypothetical protein n=1 Tax=Candidatus Nitrosocosmicus agrestis TaxID=2563600 RepID=UPI00122E9E71|nr:hypothetical protein [Candidatus Nitrosocosmicus sp. SS]KAA2280250.1 hypothetical protein F1Z66_11655 [Candidatus Nitrosocosmicus sp. SS]KAF0869493.1 hypothetical protein E5N71_04490 [Candidatus Nitrosocosmicus sp. SS]